MPPKDRRFATKFYQEDVVQKVDDPNSFAVVLRCWYDDDETAPNPLDDPLMRPLKRGEIGVSFFQNGAREILPEDAFILLDRNFQPGDICKRNINDVQSGVVVNLKARGKVEHVISHEPVEEWITVDDVEPPAEAEIGDYVTYDDWIGQVVELYDECIIETANKDLVRLPEVSLRFQVGDRGANIVPQQPSFFGFLSSMTSSGDGLETVLAVRHTVLTICWLALNQSLDPREAVKRQRPQRFWSGQDLSKLTLLRGKWDNEFRIGDKVRLKSQWRNRAPVTAHGGNGSSTIHVHTYIVRDTHTEVNVLWQDGKIETVDSKDLIPYLNPDEYDCWPGDHVIWKSEGSERPAVVQHVNAAERTACIMYTDSREKEIVSVLELDSHGTGGWDVSGAFQEGLGVRLGDFVFVHPPGKSDGASRLRVPCIGEFEPWVREPPTDESGHLIGWREDLNEIGSTIAQRSPNDQSYEGSVNNVRPGDGTFNWFGEVTKLLLDGRAEVTHPDMSVSHLPIERLTRLFDGMDQLEDDMWGDEHSSMSEDPQEGSWYLDDDGQWVEAKNLEDDGWEDYEDADDDMSVDEVQAPNPVPAMPVPLHGVKMSKTLMLAHGLSADMEVETAVPSPPPSESTATATPTAELSEPLVVEANGSGERAEPPWKRFEILPSAPVDHTFYSTPVAQPSRTFHARLNKEYRALINGLPDSIIVRTYEDRVDLIRSLIIGPENTPYEDAPFVIDWMLESDFPTSPPKAHFLSWTNGNGRVNPNLYEEGKVCLSILGTWSGDKNEIWSPARSSLLQAFVSIQGLVLVKEPWYCEPAYEKLRGTEEGTVNSRLYSEKAYVLSRGFVRRALEIPLGDLESEINWLYISDGRLSRVIQKAHALIQKNKDSLPDSDDADAAIPRLTAGGTIALGRTLSRLEAIVQQPQ